MRIAIASVVLGYAVAAIAAQTPAPPPQENPQTRPALRDKERPVIIEGCIRGNRLKVDRDFGSLAVKLLGVPELILQASKETMQMLKKEHEGHQDEISGIVVIPAGSSADVMVKDVGGKTRVTSGSSGSTTGQGFKQVAPLRLKIGTLRHLSTTCTIAG